jgi:hypothetical protein
MNTPGPEKNFHTVLIIAGVALAVGSSAGYFGFSSAFGPEHGLLGLRAGALISQVLVWGSVIVVGMAHWVVEGFHALASSSKALPTMTVSPDQLERPITGTAGTQTPAVAQPTRHEEVAV